MFNAFAAAMLTLYRSGRLPAAKEVGYNASKERMLRETPARPDFHSR
jgi:hypothetical protein